MKETIIISETEADEAARQEVIFKNCGSFTDCISELNNMQIDNAKGLDIVIPM